MLKLVSTTLSKNTSRLVEQTIKDSVKTQVVPSISKIVQAAVKHQITKGVADALKEVCSLHHQAKRADERTKLTC